MWGVAAAVGAGGAAVVASILVLLSGSPASGAPADGDEQAAGTVATASRRAREDCSTRSEARFPGAFTRDTNLVVGPLALMGGTFTDAGTVREHGGNKFPLLVKAGHKVTVTIAPRGRRMAGLAYGPQRGGERTLRDSHASVTFVACRRGRTSGSSADGVAVTFWSGFVVARAPACVPLEITVDREPSPRRVGLSLGRRCP